MVPQTRGPGLGDSDLWAIKDIQASLGLGKWEHAAVPMRHGLSRATCAHFPTAPGEAEHCAAGIIPGDGHLDPPQPCPWVFMFHRDVGAESDRDFHSCPLLRA